MGFPACFLASLIVVVLVLGFGKRIVPQFAFHWALDHAMIIDFLKCHYGILSGVEMKLLTPR